MNVHLKCIRGAVAAGLLLAALAAHAGDPNPPSIHSERGAWPLLRQWNPAEFEHYSRWIARIYDRKCHGTCDQWLAKLEYVLTDPDMNLLLDPEFSGEANPQLPVQTMRAVHSVVDCGKLTVALGAYYAYRRGLPWMITTVRSGDGTDLRTAAYTVPAGAMSCLDYASVHAFFVDAVTCLCTGNYRVEPRNPKTELSDTAPVAIDRRYLIPGCLFYQDGHILIVAHIDKYGEPHFLDATTSPTRDLYTHNGMNAVTGITPRHSDDYAGCYHGFRVYRFPIAETSQDGKVTRVRRRTDAEMQEFGYSLEQYDRLKELKETGAIAADGLQLDSFHKFLTYRLRTASRLDPVEDLKAFAQEVAGMLQAREQRVQEAWRDVQENGPIAFPDAQGHTNIFNAGGRWGAGSTALVDAYWRGRYFELLDALENAISWFRLTPEYLELEPLNLHAIWGQGDLAVAVLRAKRRIFSETPVPYTNSKGETVTLTLLDVEQRMYDLSFDPNHPPELRWGTKPDAPEARDLPDMPTLLPGGAEVPMAEAYRLEAYYRTMTRREVEATYLRHMYTEGFPVRDRLDTQMARYCGQKPSPPLVPHSGLLAYLKQEGIREIP